MKLLHYTTTTIQNLKQLPNHIFTGSSLIRKPVSKANKIIKEHGKEFEQSCLSNMADNNTNDDCDSAYFKYPQSEPEIQCETDNTSNGRFMSSKTKSKIRKKILAWYLASCRKKPKTIAPLTFLTLTFIQDVSDKTAVKMLNEFLTLVRHYEPQFLYLWVAEHQKSGRPHFHIINNKQWEITKYNDIWYNIQLNYGLYNPNKHSCFDVEYLKSIRKTCVYVSKYITKNESIMQCATWHCSRTISMLFTGFLSTEERQLQIQSGGKNFYVYTDKETGEMNCKKLAEWNVQEHFSLYPIYDNNILHQHYKELSEWNEFILNEVAPFVIDKTQPWLRTNVYETLLKHNNLNFN